MNVCSQMSLSAVVLNSPLRIASHIFKQMVGLVEINSHRETPAVVSDALFRLFSLNRSLFDVSLM